MKHPYPAWERSGKHLFVSSQLQSEIKMQKCKMQNAKVKKMHTQMHVKEGEKGQRLLGALSHRSGHRAPGASH